MPGRRGPRARRARGTRSVQRVERIGAGLPAVVDEQDRLEVGSRRHHELAPPGHQAGHHPFVRQDAAGAHADEPDEAALREAGTALLVDVQRGLGVGRQHARRDSHDPSRSAATAPAACASSSNRGQNEPDDVVRRGREQRVERARADHVVRW